MASDWCLGATAPGADGCVLRWFHSGGIGISTGIPLTIAFSMHSAFNCATAFQPHALRMIPRSLAWHQLRRPFWMASGCLSALTLVAFNGMGLDLHLGVVVGVIAEPLVRFRVLMHSLTALGQGYANSHFRLDP